ncbi:MAG: universal stress protein [Rhodocyclales bacterium]|nr:universal stress protein [Rhodocyclales bacterium]
MHLDAGARTAVRLNLAVDIARRNQARLTGVFGQRAAPETVGVVAHWPSKEYVEAAAAVKARFEQATAGLADCEWIDVNRGGDAELAHQIAYYARFFDLTILGQVDENAASPVPPHLAEEVAINSGRPILVMPYVGEFPTVAQHPLIAWNNSAEAAHALNDALPLIVGCQSAVLLSLDPHRDEAKASCARAAMQLAGRPRPHRLPALQPRRRHAPHPRAHDAASADVELRCRCAAPDRHLADPARGVTRPRRPRPARRRASAGRTTGNSPR